MQRPFTILRAKLTCVLALSTLLWLGAQAAQAHEVQPAVGDLSVGDGAVELVLRLALEPHLAGIDLDGLTDTDEAADNAAYDTLRALPGAALADRLPALLETWNAQPLVAVDGAPVTLDTAGVTVPDDVDVDLPREAEWRLSGPVAPDARAIVVNWPDGAGALVLRQQGVAAPFTGYIDGGASSPPVALAGGDARGGWQTFVGYIPVGFDHILPRGLDHILFVLGLFFLSTRLGPLIWQVSAFTLAHTVTLALGALEVVSVPAGIVEPLIAASIVYVAVENIFAGGLKPWRPVIVFAFGLLHGLGFASVLGEFGLPEGQFVPALVGFNIGVELGQLTVIAIAFALVGWAARQRWYRARIAVPASCIIAAVGAFWVVERVFL